MGKKSGRRVCSCTEMFGPIQIISPCKWKMEEEPVCDLADDIQGSGYKPYASEAQPTQIEAQPTQEIDQVQTVTNFAPTQKFDQTQPEFNFHDFGRMFLSGMMAPNPSNQIPQVLPQTKLQSNLPSNENMENENNLPENFADFPLISNPRELYNNGNKGANKIKICEIPLPQHELWKCTNDIMAKGTHCRIRYLYFSTV